jgi:carboxylesterase type B
VTDVESKGFTNGGANNPYYDGQALADEHDVIVVTIK